MSATISLKGSPAEPVASAVLSREGGGRALVSVVSSSRPIFWK